MVKVTSVLLSMAKCTTVAGAWASVFSSISKHKISRPVHCIRFLKSNKASFIYSHSQGVPLISSEPPFESLDLIGL